MDDKGAVRFQLDHAVGLIDIRDPRFLHDDGDATTDAPIPVGGFGAIPGNQFATLLEDGLEGATGSVGHRSRHLALADGTQHLEDVPFVHPVVLHHVELIDPQFLGKFRNGHGQREVALGRAVTLIGAGRADVAVVGVDGKAHVVARIERQGERRAVAWHRQ